MDRDDDLAVLESIQRRVLWLSTRMIDHANRERETADGLKVGGHQASSASMITVMTALWFAHLAAADRVSVKPHASPVFHAIQYLLGNLDEGALRTLRAFGGLQSYPSRTKDPDGVDFSTGSVGLGAAAPLFAAVTRRYVDAHFGVRERSRFVALLGDAELDEGNIWEAVADHATTGLGDVTWIVDFNRQSLDRVVPGVRIDQWTRQFEAAGWHVVEVKYGRRLLAAFERERGHALRGWIDSMPNEQYQSLFGLEAPAHRKTFLDGAPVDVRAAVQDYEDEELRELVQDLGGHDLALILAALEEADASVDRPTVIFAYTVKGWGLPIAGHPRNHSALLSGEEIAALRTSLDIEAAREWERPDPTSPEGVLCAERRERLERRPHGTSLAATTPTSTLPPSTRPMSTQEAFGRVVLGLSREEIGPYLVTTSPDVATSTNLAGFINRVGVFAPTDRRSWGEELTVRWTEGPNGQHIELGISEMNLFLLLGQLGLSRELSDQPLVPIGTLYDPFICRGLDSLIYSVYSGARFIFAGTPSGVTLAPEGGAHQSSITTSIGLELPNLTYCEPTYPAALDWLLCDAVAKVAHGTAPTAAAVPSDGTSFYFRLTTRAIDPTPFEQARGRLGEAVLRQQVLSGGYRLVEADDSLDASRPRIALAASGAVMPEVLQAASVLEDEGIATDVIDITSPGRLYSAWQRTLRHGVRTATAPSVAGALRTCFPGRSPIVTVHDAASHTLAWLGSALGVPSVPLGVDTFGQSGTIQDLYEAHDLLPGSIVNAALAALTLPSGAR